MTLHNPLIKADNYTDLMDGLYRYYLPKPPDDEKEILFYDRPKKLQQWEAPKILNVKSLSERERIAYITKHRERWLDGVWFFNNGEPTYITGMHYDFMTFCNFEDFGAKATYLEQQRFDFYFRDLVRNDPNSYGNVILKCRRCGMTSEELCQAVYTLLEDFNCKIGYQSNELQKKCIPELMTPTISMYLKRPKWMREDYYAPNGKKPINSLKLTSNVAKDEDYEEEVGSGRLGGNITPYPTMASAMDGSKKRYIVMDEVFKWLQSSSSDTLYINKKCVVEYGIKGKVSMLSTMGDSDSLAAAVKEGCEIWGQSNPKVRDANGRTTSGLYKWFVAAIHSADIPQQYRDVKYGKVNKEKAEEYIWNEVNKHPKGSKNYVFELRRMPPEEKYALMAANDKTYFDILRFDCRLQELYELPFDRKPYVRGNLKEYHNGNVYFEPDPEGRWLVALQPYHSIEKGVDTRNRFKVRNGVYMPPVNPEGCIGYDPIRYKTDNTVSNNLSKASIVVYKKFDYFNSGDSNQYCALMLDRPNEPREAHREAIKAARYWGFPVMAERQVETVEEEFISQNMLPFLLLSEEDKKWGIWSNQKRTENGLQMLVTRFSYKPDSGLPDQTEIYPFEVGLEDKKNFDLKNTLTSHVTMSEIMCEYGLKQILFTNQTDTADRAKLAVMNEIFAPRK